MLKDKVFDAASDYGEEFCDQLFPFLQWDVRFQPKSFPYLL